MVINVILIDKETSIKLALICCQIHLYSASKTMRLDLKFVKKYKKQLLSKIYRQTLGRNRASNFK